MNVPALQRLLERVRAGGVSLDDALRELKDLPFADLGYAMVDHHRALRQGVPEVIFGLGKTPEQIVGIAQELARTGQNVLITRLDQEKAVAKGEFREDLYFRLNVVTLTVPPLRERREDIIPLTEQFLARSAIALKKPVRTLGESAQALLRQYHFPGNVRELSNLIERAVLFCQGSTLEAVNFPSDIQGAPPPFRAKPISGLPPAADSSDPMTTQIAFRVGEQTLSDLEDRIIAEVLRRSDGNKTLAAKHLGITRWTLDRRRKS